MQFSLHEVTSLLQQVVFHLQVQVVSFGEKREQGIAPLLMHGPCRSIPTWEHNPHSLLSNLCLIGCRKQMQPGGQQLAHQPGAGLVVRK